MKTNINGINEVLRENYRMFLVINNIAYLGFLAHSLFIVLFYWLGVTPLAFLNVISVMAWVVAFYINKKGRHRDAIILLAGEVILHAFMAVYFLGWESGFHYYLVPLIPFMFFNHRQTTPIIIGEAALLFISYISLYIYTNQAGNYIEIEPFVLNALLYTNIAVNFIALGIIGYYFRVASIHSEKEMERLATTDTLTKLFNRRKMREMLERERLRFERDKKAFIIVITDIDHFKKFNDNYGHDCGDYVLQEVSQLMKSCLRKQDVIARWGGEEFLILLPETELEGGMQAIEKMRETIADTTYQFEGNEFSVTMTFGVTVFDGSLHIDGCIKQADEVLYVGKREGRNRVVAVGV